MQLKSILVFLTTLFLVVGELSLYGGNGQGNGKGHAYGRFKNDQASIDALAAEISLSAAQDGIGSPAGAYQNYAEQLASTLSQFDEEQQARIFQ